MSVKSILLAAAVALTFSSGAAFSEPQPLIDAVSAETTAPSAKGDVTLLNISKMLKCKDGESACTASLNGKKGKQTVITAVSCLSFVQDGSAMFGAITAGKTSLVAHAIIPVTSRAINGTAEAAVISGPTQVSLGPDDKVTIGVAATVATISQVICNVTGTVTKL